MVDTTETPCIVIINVSILGFCFYERFCVVEGHFWVTISIYQRDQTFDRYIRTNTHRKQQQISTQTILFFRFADQKT